jgi:hypothetical protein
VFGRRKQQQQQEEAAREAERRALFEELAKRPDTICPFLGLQNARTEFRDRVSDGHRCYAFGDPADLSAEQQQKVCLQRGYGNCPRYLRGVLVIPTEELEALRHPSPAPPPPAATPAAVAAKGGGSRRGLLVAVVVLLLMLGGGGAAFMALNGGAPIAQQTATPGASGEPGTPAPSASQPAGASVTPAPTPAPTPSPTPIALPSSGALPTPGPGDTPTGYAVRVEAGQYAVAEMDGNGTILGPAQTNFDGTSWAPVQRITLDGDVYWRTLQGGYTGRAYSRALSGGFIIYETFQNAAGNPRFRELDEGEY